MVTVWNSHRIRPSRNERVPAGRPVVMYSVPQLYQTRDYLQQVDRDAVDVCMAECTFISAQNCCDDDVYLLCDLYMTQNGWILPVDHATAVTLYINLHDAIHFDL